MKGKDFMIKSVGVIGFIVLVGITGGFESKYTCKAECTGYLQGVYSFTDKGGEVWEWEAEKDDNFIIGDPYKLIMDDNHTSSVSDDWIYKIKKVSKRG